MFKVDPGWGYTVGYFVERGSRARPHIFCLFISLLFEYIISSLDSRCFFVAKFVIYHCITVEPL